MHFVRFFPVTKSEQQNRSLCHGFVSKLHFSVLFIYVLKGLAHILMAKSISGFFNLIPASLHNTLKKT